MFLHSIQLKQARQLNTYAPVAQLDRVFGYEPKGRGFESLQARHLQGFKIEAFLFAPVRDAIASLLPLYFFTSDEINA